MGSRHLGGGGRARPPDAPLWSLYHHLEARLVFILQYSFKEYLASSLIVSWMSWPNNSVTGSRCRPSHHLDRGLVRLFGVPPRDSSRNALSCAKPPPRPPGQPRPPGTRRLQIDIPVVPEVLEVSACPWSNKIACGPQDSSRPIRPSRPHATPPKELPPYPPQPDKRRHDGQRRQRRQANAQDRDLEHLRHFASIIP